MADITAVYGCCSAYNSTYQLRNGSSADYVSSATPPTPGGLPTVGDQVVIYNQNAQAVLAAQNDNATSPAINKAAASLYASQSNLSTAIKDLERELGITIFTRSSTGICLS